jgi:cell division septal protein FtsQ
MTTTTKPTPHSELVRRRRLEKSKQRFDAASQAANPARRGTIVSRPRVTGSAFLPRSRAGGWAMPRLELPRIHPTWRMASFSMVLLLGALLIRLLTDPALFVDGINLGGAALVPGEEIYAESGVARQHIFWVNPVDVHAKVAAVPGIASAHVEVKWPNVVTIIVVERIPVITWVEGDKQWWVDAAGQRFKARGALPGLLPITLDEPGKTYEQIPVAAIEGALQLKALRPNIELLHYDSTHGLSYQDGRNWRGYFGVGADMAQKLAVYETLVDNLLSRGIHPMLISVEDLKTPYYRQ